MSTKFKTLLSLTALAAFFVSAAAMADFRDYNDKGWNSIYRREHSAATTNRAAAPVIVRSEAAPVAVAQAPTQERAYSYEPAKQAAGASGSTSNTTSDKSAAAAPQSTKVRRSFSYEPSTSGSVRHGSTSRGGNSYENAMRAKGY